MFKNTTLTTIFAALFTLLATCGTGEMWGTKDVALRVVDNKVEIFVLDATTPVKLQEKKNKNDHKYVLKKSNNTLETRYLHDTPIRILGVFDKGSGSSESSSIKTKGTLQKQFKDTEYAFYLFDKKVEFNAAFGHWDQIEILEKDNTINQDLKTVLSVIRDDQELKNFLNGDDDIAYKSQVEKTNKELEPTSKERFCPAFSTLFFSSLSGISGLLFGSLQNYLNTSRFTKNWRKTTLSITGLGILGTVMLCTNSTIKGQKPNKWLVASTGATGFVLSGYGLPLIKKYFTKI